MAPHPLSPAARALLLAFRAQRGRLPLLVKPAGLAELERAHLVRRGFDPRSSATGGAATLYVLTGLGQRAATAEAALACPVGCR